MLAIQSKGRYELMQPIFKEQIQMWGGGAKLTLPVNEGLFWLENNFIQAFTRDGVLHKLYKYKVDDNLSIKITPVKNIEMYNIKDFETWSETVNRYSEHLQKLENDSIEVVIKVLSQYSDFNKYILSSTGKDSIVTQHIVNKVNPTIPVVFNNTSLDAADTYKIVNQHKDWIITHPKLPFYKWIEKEKYIPTRFSRACCTLFKEGNMIDYFQDISKALFFMGVRNDESSERANREDVSHNPKWGKREWMSCLPIRKWTDLDVWLYIFKNNLEINPKYKKGYKRVGCAVACPYATKYTWVLDDYYYPKMRNRWLNILDKDFTEESKWTSLNCTRQEYKTCWNGGLYRQEPNEEVIAEFMKYKGITDKNLALQYFNKICYKCGKNVRQNEVLAMNLKTFGRQTNKIYCKNCFMKELNIDKTTWSDTVSDFKSQDCVLF